MNSNAKASISRNFVLRASELHLITVSQTETEEWYSDILVW